MKNCDTDQLLIDPLSLLRNWWAKVGINVENKTDIATYSSFSR